MHPLLLSFLFAQSINQVIRDFKNPNGTDSAAIGTNVSAAFVTAPPDGTDLVNTTTPTATTWPDTGKNKTDSSTNYSSSPGLSNDIIAIIVVVSVLAGIGILVSCRWCMKNQDNVVKVDEPEDTPPSRSTFSMEDFMQQETLSHSVSDFGNTMPTRPTFSKDNLLQPMSTRHESEYYYSRQ